MPVIKAEECPERAWRSDAEKHAGYGKIGERGTERGRGSKQTETKTGNGRSRILSETVSKTLQGLYAT